jgi:hypothetical protein
MWEHEYDLPAERVLLDHLGYPLNERLAKQVTTFARTGEGKLERVDGRVAGAALASPCAQGQERPWNHHLPIS